MLTLAHCSKELCPDFHRVRDFRQSTGYWSD
jgi:hypothetical protein